MSDFDYGNTRIRAMKSRLLSRQALDTLAGSENMSNLLNSLTKTSYRSALEVALVQYTGLAAVNKALQDDLQATIRRTASFFTGTAAADVAFVFTRYDVDNLKTILRGLNQHLAADEILANTFPVGSLSLADLSELARMENARAVLDLLITWGIPLAYPLLTLRARRPMADLVDMELALEQWYFTRAGRETVDILKQALRLEADLINLLTVLRLVGVPEAPALLQQRFGNAAISPLLVGPGKVPFVVLQRMAVSSSLGEAITILDSTSYGPILNDVLRQYGTTRRLSTFELALVRYRQQQAVTFFVKDPLGIGVLVGYLILKTAEVSNLRHIAQGISLGVTGDDIRAGLI